ncbi:MAG: hypothetical protein QOI89_2716 [Solirubrobacteraceae bacterium]|jgi:hypothetical protein|nr:hypothetical protein [Solirubrobacteraceae bacterium]
MKVKLPRKTPLPEADRVVEVDYSKPSAAPWSAEKLYSLSQEHQRLLVLEMLTWAIAHAEQIETRSAWDDFKRELKAVRIETKGRRPWSQATDHERFLAHLVVIANTFVDAVPVAALVGEGRRARPDPAR